MRFALSLYIAVGCTFFSQLNQCQAAPWRQFTSVSGDFKVLLPATPKQSKEVEKSDEGDTTVYSFEVEHRGDYYSVGYMDLPAITRIQSTKSVLDEFQVGLTEGLEKVRVLGVKPIALNKVQGRAMTLRDADGITYHVRVYRVRQRVYSTVTLTAPGEETKRAPAIQRFATSFQLIGKYPGPIKTAEWSRFSSEKGRFSIEAPGAVSQQRHLKRWGRASIAANGFSHTAEKVHFAVGYVDVPGQVAAADPVTFLDDFQKGFFSAMAQKWKAAGFTKFNFSPAGIALSQRSITIGDWPARELRFIDPSDVVHKVQILLVYHRMYILDVAVARENETIMAGEINRFLASLKVIPNKDGDVPVPQEGIASTNRNSLKRRELWFAVR